MEANTSNLHTSLSKRAKKRLNNKTNKSIRNGKTISQVTRESMNERQYVRYHHREINFYTNKCSQNPHLDTQLVEELCNQIPQKYPKISQQLFQEVKKQYENSLFTLATLFQNVSQVEYTNISGDEECDDTETLSEYDDVIDVEYEIVKIDERKIRKDDNPNHQFCTRDLYYGYEPSVSTCPYGKNKCRFLHVSHNSTLHKPWIPLEKRSPKFHETTISMCVWNDCFYNHFNVSYFASIPFTNIQIAFDDSVAFDFAQIAFNIDLTPSHNNARDYNPKYDYVKRHELFKNFLDCQQEKIIIGHDTESNVSFDGKGNVLSLLQYAYGEHALIVCLLSYENISNSLFFKELHTNKNVIICTFTEESLHWLNIQIIKNNHFNIQKVLEKVHQKGQSLKYYYENTFPKTKKLNKSNRYRMEKNWERHYCKDKFSSYDALNYAAMDAVATWELGIQYGHMII